jgi:hypothetical protein
MITYTWTIDWMNVASQTIDSHTEVVLSAQWRCFGIDSESTTSSQIYKGCSFPMPAAGGSFTPYANLTQEQVLDWCYANGVDQTAIEGQIAANIFATNNPPVVQPPLPWITPPTIETIQKLNVKVDTQEVK